MSVPAPRYPVWDNHFHLDPHGRVEEAVKEFHRAGGTHLMVVHKPYFREGQARRFNRTLEDHREQFELTLALAERARKAVPEVRMFVALAPHPAEFTKLLEAGVPMEEAADAYRAASELAARYVREGRAVAMSEVGRPHWRPVPDEVLAKANELMQHQFELAREAGCAVQIHAESATPESFADLRAWADRARLSPEKVVKHYSTPIVDERNAGLWPSVLVGKSAAEEALRQGTRFLMETDYTDEPLVEDVATKKRMSGYAWRHANPGKRFLVDCRVVGATGEVLGPKTVPRRTRELIEKGLMTEEQAWVVHAENPRRVYGVDVAL